MFFLLSGFVLGYQYEPRFSAGMTFWQFALARVFRLYPLYLFGLALGIVIAILFSTSLTARDIGIAGLANLLMLPYGLGLAAETPSTFSLNDPFWSLFFEMWIANLLFALLRHHLSTKVLFSLIGLSAAYLLYTEEVYQPERRSGVVQFLGWLRESHVFLLHGSGAGPVS